MADLFSASVEARPMLGLSRVPAPFLPSSSCLVPWGCQLKFHGPRSRVCISSNRMSIGCLLSKTTSTTSDASSSSTPESPLQTGLSEFDVVSTSEYSDGSIVFRFGHVTEMEKNVVRLEGGKMGGAGTNEAASESLLSEESKRIASLEVLQEDQQATKLCGDGVNEAAPQSLLKEDTTSVVAVEKVGPVNTLELGQRPGSDSVKELTVDSQEIVNAESVVKETGDLHVLAEHEELHDSSELTQFGLPRSDSFDPEISPNYINEMSHVPFAEPDLDGTVNLGNNSIIRTESDGSFTQNINADSFVEKAIDLEDSPQTDALEEDDYAGPSDPEKAIRLEEESLEGTSDEDSEAANLEELRQANALDDCIKAAKNKDISSTRTEERDITLSSSGANFEVTAYSYNTSQEQSKENIELENNGEFSNPEEAADGGEESSNIKEISDISRDESESDRHNSNREEILMSEICLTSGAASLPHPSKALTGGEDAYFISGENWLGVADGASQWSMEGTNSGLYAHELMENCEAIASSPGTRLLDLLERSAAETESVGSSTVLVAHFEGQVLHVANIGDSGFIIIRNGTITNRSSPMVHEFNFPEQIERGHDPSEFAECYRIELDEDDVIIVATDGLFDNLYEKEIASIVHRSLQVGLSPQGIAEVLANRAQEVGGSTSARSPFADAAQAVGYVGFTGGKLDDVTVIVSLVKKSSSSRT